MTRRMAGLSLSTACARPGAMRRGLVLVGLFVTATCASQRAVTKEGPMSAEDHRAAAREERALASQDAGRYDPAATRPLPPPPGPADAALAFPLAVYNPTDRHLREADQHRAHARAHESAAAALERFEDGACKQFPPATRAACPLLVPVTRLEDLPEGVRVVFAPGTRVDAVVAHMRCHYAYARAHGFDARSSCPLYLPGIEIRQASPDAIDITTPRAGDVGLLRTRCRDEAVVTGGTEPRR